MKDKGQQSVELMLLVGILVTALIIVTALVLYYNDMKAELDLNWHLNNECTKLVNQITMVNSYRNGMSSRFSTVDYNSTFYNGGSVIQLESGESSAFCVYPEMRLIDSSGNSTFTVTEFSTIQIDNNGTNVVITVV